MKNHTRILLSAVLGAGLLMGVQHLRSLSPLQNELFAQGIQTASGDTVVISYEKDQLLVILNTANKKFLTYEYKSNRGWQLVEVRSYLEALAQPPFQSSRGIGVKEEQKEFEKNK